MDVHKVAELEAELAQARSEVARLTHGLATAQRERDEARQDIRELLASVEKIVVRKANKA